MATGKIKYFPPSDSRRYGTHYLSVKHIYSYIFNFYTDIIIENISNLIINKK